MIIVGVVVLVSGLVLSEGTALLRTPLLYDADPDLGREDPQALAGMAGGYLLLALGPVLTSLVAIVTLLRACPSSNALGLGCCRFGGHRDKVFHRIGGRGWGVEYSVASSSSRRSG
ncbi:MAG: hypothetical protein KGK10_01310 [Rhodospirillales bacterium]|nr:hypothetical protein [Rhodospirillales bacterium]